MSEQKIGVASHYWGNLSVAGLRITDGELRVGDTIHIKGHTSDFIQSVESMQIENQTVEVARPGDDVEKGGKRDRFILSPAITKGHVASYFDLGRPDRVDKPIFSPDLCVEFVLPLLPRRFSIVSRTSSIRRADSQGPAGRWGPPHKGSTPDWLGGSRSFGEGSQLWRHTQGSEPFQYYHHTRRTCQGSGLWLSEANHQRQRRPDVGVDQRGHYSRHS